MEQQSDVVFTTSGAILGFVAYLLVGLIVALIFI